ncbi:MAG: aminotransferase class I/II-fold pyridoxal phosphate-dependent enzyme [Phycisphaerales bacterium JB040]
MHPDSVASDPTAPEDSDYASSFAGCDYLALARHPRLLDAATAAVARHALTSSASRTTTGDTRVHQSLDRRLAAWTGHEAGLVVPDGLIANIVACQTALALGIRRARLAPGSHRSLEIAIRASGLTPIERGSPPIESDEPVLFLTDAVFTSTGAIADVPALLASLPTPGSVLLLDDCHGFPVLGDGRGTRAEFAITDPRVWTTTSLAKGIGAGGGAFLASKDAIDRAWTHADAFVCTTPPSPALAGAALASLDLIQNEPDRITHLQALCADLAERLAGLGLGDHEPRTPVFAIGLDEHSIDPFRHAASAHAVRVPVMSYPGGPAPRYARISLNASHTRADLDRLCAALEEWLDAR